MLGMKSESSWRVASAISCWAISSAMYLSHNSLWTPNCDSPTPACMLLQLQNEDIWSRECFLCLLEWLSIFCFHWPWSTLIDNSRHLGPLLEKLSRDTGLRLQWLNTDWGVDLKPWQAEEGDGSALPQPWGRAFPSECLWGVGAKLPSVVHLAWFP